MFSLVKTLQTKSISVQDLVIEIRLIVWDCVKIIKFS